MFLLEKIDAIGKPAWIALTILGFWVAWPLGLATLAFAALSGRFVHFGRSGPGRWYNTTAAASHGCRWKRRMRHASSGSTAFDEYRAETIQRLEEEQREFVEYLEHLRRAKDRAEFDQFMAERRARQAPTAPPEPPPETP